MNEWQKWFNEQTRKSTMSVEQIPLAEVNAPWGMQEDGNFGRSDRAFFRYIGLRITSAGREVNVWDQPAGEEMGPGAVGLIVNDEGEILVTAKQEPGNPVKLKHTLLAPAIQTSLSNLQQVHGGKQPPYAELLNNKESYVTFWQDGGRNFEKQNTYSIKGVGVNEIDLLPNATLITAEDLATAILSGCANEHLIQAFALLAAQRMSGR